MTTAEQKERALGFLRALEKADSKAMGEVLADDFEFEMMGKLPGISPVRGKQVFVENIGKTIRGMFPNGLNMTFSTVIADGPHVAIQAASDTVAGNGKKYANRYHFYFLFKGDKIAQVREYNDVNHVREVFMS
jgi:ketosteroid isomerase-like protein